MLRKLLFLLIYTLSITLSHEGLTSTPVDTEAMKSVERTEIRTAEDKQRLEHAAVLLANYEIESKKLLGLLNTPDVAGAAVSEQAGKLMTMSESVIDSARFRLPQCEDYLAKSLLLKNMLNDISHERLEHDYHHDGALPKAAPECYHTKDLFVHPATVIVLTRDDPALSETTRTSIKAEITEVLAHTELVRQLVIY